jgi:hypothetical protein
MNYKIELTFESMMNLQSLIIKLIVLMEHRIENTSSELTKNLSLKTIDKCNIINDILKRAGGR